ncbi:MAG: sugar phosphate nucleotidyltransferase, partial [Candidatus Izemoplasma sp.]
IIESNDDGLITGFEEKPKNPKSSNASMGIYVFKRQVLKKLLSESNDYKLDFGKDIIPSSIKQNYKTYMYKFNGYFRDVGTINSLYAANMDLIDNPEYLDINNYKEFPIYTRSSELPPHHIISSAKIKNCLISDGCIIKGNIDHSVLSSGIVVEAGASIKDAIIFPNVIINKNVIIEKAFILENLVIEENTKLIFEFPTVVDEDYLQKLGDANE